MYNKDSSDIKHLGAGHVIYQLKDDDGKNLELSNRLFIGYGSKKFDPAQINYTNLEKELFANSLLNSTNPRISRWLQEISIYNPKISYIEGQYNYISDGLSRFTFLVKTSGQPNTVVEMINRNYLIPGVRAKPVPKFCFEVISIDLITKLPSIVFENREICKIGSNYRENFSPRIKSKLEKSPFYIFGYPRVIVSDSDRRFTSKFWILLGHHPHTPLSLVDYDVLPSNIPSVKERIETKVVLANVRELLRISKLKMKYRTDKNKNHHKFTIGETVFVRNNANKMGKFALDPKYFGPVRITAIDGTDFKDNTVMETVHVENVKTFPHLDFKLGDDSLNEDDEENDDDYGESFEVEPPYYNTIGGCKPNNNDVEPPTTNNIRGRNLIDEPLESNSLGGNSTLKPVSDRQLEMHTMFMNLWVTLTTKGGRSHAKHQEPLKQNEEMDPMNITPLALKRKEILDDINSLNQNRSITKVKVNAYSTPTATKLNLSKHIDKLLLIEDKSANEK
eukprot:gene10427-12805_t